jgi:hypothetical protein
MPGGATTPVRGQDQRPYDGISAAVEVDQVANSYGQNGHANVGPPHQRAVSDFVEQRVDGRPLLLV